MTSGIGGYNLGNAFGRIVITDNVDDAVNSAQRSFDRGLRGIGQSMQSFGDSMTGLGTRLTLLTAPLTAFGVQGIRTAMNFETAMAEISARTGLVGDDLDAIAQAAKDMGAATVFSSQDAANAFLQLLSSGQSAEEALATLPHVLTAAAAGGMDLGRTADGVTDIMAAFNLEVEEAASIVDSMSRASASSSADMGQLQDAFANVGGVASQFGLSVDETAAIFAVFAENGKKGAEAGTQLKSMLLNMTRPVDGVQGAWKDLGISVYDTEGNIRDIASIMDDLRTVMNSGEFTEQELNDRLITIGGSYGILGLTALATGDSMEDMQELMAGQTDAATVAAARMDTFAGATESLKGSIETLQIQVLTPFMNDVLKPLVVRAIEIVNGFTAWADANPELTKTIVKVGAALIVLGPALVATGIAISTMGIAISALASPIVLAIGAVSALGAAWINNFMGIQDRVLPVIDAVRDTVMGFVDELRPLTNELGIFFKRMFSQIDVGKMLQVGQTMLAMTNPIGQISLVLKAMGVNFGAILGGVIDGLTTFFATINEGGSVFDGMRAVFGDSAIWATLQDGLNRIVVFVQDTVIPGLNHLRDWFISDALPAVVNFVETNVLPVIQSFIGWLANIWTIVQPGLTSLGRWFTTEVMPQVSAILSNFIELLGSIWEVVGPALGDLAEWFLTSGLPLIGQFITDVALPYINGFIDVLSTIWAVVGPPLGVLLNWFTSVGLPLATAVLSDIVMPALNLLIDTLAGIWSVVEGPLGFLSSGISSVFNWIIDNVLEPFIDVLEGILGVIGDVVNGVNDVVNEIDRVASDLLGSIGGSANPFREGSGIFRGVGDALNIGRNPDEDNAMVIANDMAASQRMLPASTPESGLSQRQQQPINVQIDVPLDVLRNEPGLQRNADSLAASLNDAIRRRG